MSAECDDSAQFHKLAPLFSSPYLLGMAPQTYYRRWDVYLRGERIGEVLAATKEAACLRAVHRFKIKDEDRSELEVRRVSDAA
jgi:hypothetical protein